MYLYSRKIVCSGTVCDVDLLGSGETVDPKLVLICCLKRFVEFCAHCFPFLGSTLVLSGVALSDTLTVPDDCGVTDVTLLLKPKTVLGAPGVVLLLLASGSGAFVSTTPASFEFLVLPEFRLFDESPILLTGYRMY